MMTNDTIKFKFFSFYQKGRNNKSNISNFPKACLYSDFPEGVIIDEFISNGIDIKKVGADSTFEELIEHTGIPIDSEVKLACASGYNISTYKGSKETGIKSQLDLNYAIEP